jgi:hypothetical protein
MLVLIISFPLSAQKVKWQRSQTVAPALALFHSSHAINLPTAETLQKGDFEFEISHRFVPPMSEGYDALWGLDGPAHIRFGQMKMTFCHLSWLSVLAQPGIQK